MITASPNGDTTIVDLTSVAARAGMDNLDVDNQIDTDHHRIIMRQV